MTRIGTDGYCIDCGLHPDPIAGEWSEVAKQMLPRHERADEAVTVSLERRGFYVRTKRIRPCGCGREERREAIGAALKPNGILEDWPSHRRIFLLQRQS